MKRGPYKGREAEYEQVRALREQGRGLLWISKQTGVAQGTVRSWTADIQVDPRKAQALHNSERAPGATKDALRRRLVKEHGGACQSCGRKRWLKQPIPLELHKLDPSKGYTETNVRLLCCNCHGLTDTWRGRGKAGVRNR